MAKSLQEQLLGAGLVDTKKAKQVKQEQRKKAKQRPKGAVETQEAKEWAEKARQEKLEKDRELNRQRDEAAQEKAILGQIRQLIETNRLDRSGGEEAYQFADGKLIKKVFVSSEQFKLLVSGRLAICRLDEGYEIVPAKVAEKIAERNDEFVVVQNTKEEAQMDEDDPYKDYVIPDDLMW